jgi:hypothetical protein
VTALQRPERDVRGHGTGEEERGLHDHADPAPQISRVQFTIVPAIEPHGAAGRLVEAVEQPQERRLARSAWTDHGHHLAGAHLHADVVDQNLPDDGTGQTIRFNRGSARRRTIRFPPGRWCRVCGCRFEHVFFSI